MFHLIGYILWRNKLRTSFIIYTQINSNTNTQIKTNTMHQTSPMYTHTLPVSSRSQSKAHLPPQLFLQRLFILHPNPGPDHNCRVNQIHPCEAISIRQLNQIHSNKIHPCPPSVLNSSSIMSLVSGDHLSKLGGAPETNLVKVGNLAQTAWPPSAPRTLGFFPWICRKFSAIKGQICHKKSAL